MPGRFYFKLAVCLLFQGFALSWAQGRLPARDTTFWHLSLPELQSYRVYYLQELEELQEEKTNLIKRGIEDGERLLQTKPDAKVVDGILFRLADLYYYQEKDDYLNRMEQYDYELDRLANGEIQESPEEPVLECARSMNIYQRVIDEFPQSQLVDDAVYNKGFIYEEMRQGEEARRIYLHLISAYPESKYVPESYMRLGEYYFNPPQIDLSKAIGMYKKVIEYPNSLRYEEALYKLGWSYYRLSQYPEAISYFTTLVENIQTTRQYDPNSLGLTADLGDEALEYVAISFIDFGGPAKAREYLKQLEDPDWGFNVLEKLGDVYHDEKEEYPNAIIAYRSLLDYAPSSLDAPLIHRKIVDCYESLNDDQEAYSVRQEIFSKYKAEGQWWKESEDDKAKLRAYKIAEQALRENINYRIQDAETKNSLDDFKEAVELGRVYLESFPEDPYAYMIRWNIALILDTKLMEYKQALQEYLTISMVYSESRYTQFAREKGLATIQDAAENAVVVADSLVQRERRETAMPEQGVVQGNDPVPFTAAESWLAMAFDNYLKLFPFEKSSPAILANAGALYFTRNQFTEALKYFKTLMDYFPDSEQVHNVQYNILESYFGKQDYESAEVFAKRIMGTNVADDIKAKAEKRLGEAIFLKAQLFAEVGKDSSAAKDFYRVAVEVPSIEFADRALFNAGAGYDKIQAYPSAIRSYELLRDSYSGSSFLKDALNNLAFDYGEVGNYKKGGDAYKELIQLLTDEEKIRDALYNACVFYEKAESWNEAVETGEDFVRRFPESEDAPTLYLRMGDFYNHLDDGRNAIRIFSDFAQRFPDSPLGVEAYYRLGKYHLDRNLFMPAEQAFLQAYSTYEHFKTRGIESNTFYAAEGLYLASRSIHRRFEKITFTLPQETMDREKERKQSMLQQLVDQYTKVTTHQTSRTPESVYRLGEVYENYAYTWAMQEIVDMDPTTRAVKEKEVSTETTQIYSQALTAYRKGSQVLEKILEETAAEVSSDTSGLASTPDSLVTLTGEWLGRTQEKVSFVLYQMAEVNTRSVDHFERAPIPADLSEMAQLEYRSQVLLKAIKPILDVVVEAHLRNLQVSDSLNIHNRWTQASRSKILTSLSYMARKYAQLSFDALAGYKRCVQECRQTAILREQTVPEDVISTMINFIELSKSYSQAAVILSKEDMNRAFQSRFFTTDNNETRNVVVGFVLQLADSLESLINHGFKDQNTAEDHFNRTEALVYEDALALFEDNVYFLNENLKTILELAYQAEEEFDSPSPLGQWLAIRLVRMDPNKYARQLRIPMEVRTFPIDSTWWYTPRHNPGWERVDYPMRGWMHPTESIVLADIQMRNQAAGSRNSAQTQSEQFVYLRKVVDVGGYPITGEVRFSGDVAQQMFFNQSRISQIKKKTDISPLLIREGGNVAAIKYKQGQRFLEKGTMRIWYVPRQKLPGSGG